MERHKCTWIPTNLYLSFSLPPPPLSLHTLHLSLCFSLSLSPLSLSLSISLSLCLAFCIISVLWMTLKPICLRHCWAVEPLAMGLVGDYICVTQARLVLPRTTF